MFAITNVLTPVFPDISRKLNSDFIGNPQYYKNYLEMYLW